MGFSCEGGAGVGAAEVVARGLAACGYSNEPTHDPKAVYGFGVFAGVSPHSEIGAASKDAAPLLLRQPCGRLLFCDCEITWRKQAPRYAT